MLHLWDMDHAGHANGPDPALLGAALAAQDELAREVISQFDLETDAIFIWSDHGMLSVTRTLDLQAALPPPATGELRFLDSTLGRFWFASEKDQARVEEILGGVSGGHVLTESEKESLGVAFHDNRYGDLIFLADRGALLFPNAFQDRYPVKGMHGYDLQDSNEWGIFASNRVVLPADASMEDVLSRMLSAMGLSALSDGGKRSETEP